MAEVLLAFCRSHGLHGWQATCLHLLAEAQLAGGAVDAARQAAEEGLRIAEYGEHEHRACHLRATLAAVFALQGDTIACRESAESAIEHADAHRIGTAAVRAARALAWSHLGSGDPEAAYALLEKVLGDSPLLTAFLLPDLVEAGARSGRAVAEYVEAYGRWAAITKQPLTDALAARCRALALGPAETDAAEPHFREALGHHEALDTSFEQARTLLLYGEWLRRRLRRTDARRTLRSALEIFDRLGTPAWAERARTELRGTGEVADQGRETGTVLDRLTPQEREVVRLAAAGATNRDIATQLFLSPRTVGHHLYRAFPKLGISSRSQLAEFARGIK
jgi:DNA-binding NarL/FixJ family response regulator